MKTLSSFDNIKLNLDEEYTFAQHIYLHGQQELTSTLLNGVSVQGPVKCTTNLNLAWRNDKWVFQVKPSYRHSINDRATIYVKSVRVIVFSDGVVVLK